jgi:hypothetical protein
VYRHKATKTRPYKVYYYYDNDEGVKDNRAFPVCLYKGEWYQLLQDKTTGGPKLGGPVPELHEWDNDTVKVESSVEDTESDDIKEDKQLNQEIWQSPISPVLSAPKNITMSTTVMQTTPAITITTD